MRIRSGVGAALFFVVLTLALSYPFSTHLTTHVLSHGTDMDLAVWTIGWDVHSLTHQPWKIFDANIFFPFHNTLAYSENLIGVSFIAAPVIWLTGNVILGMNIAALLSVAIGAFGAFLLARKLGLSTAAALIAGVIFGFAPPRFLRMDQLPISSVQWIPFALLALHTYFDTKRARYLRIAIALYALQALSSGHGAAMLTLAIGLLLIWKWVCGEPIAPAQRLRDVGWQGTAALVPAALIYLPYKFAQIEVGLQRQLDDWSISTSSFFTSPTHVHMWLRSVLPDWHWLTGDPDAWLFPGVLPLVLAGYAVAQQWTSASTERQGRAWRRVAFALSVLGLAFTALGVYVAVTGGLRVRSGNRILFSAHGATPWIQCAVFVVLRLALLRKVPFAPLTRLRAWGRHVSAWRASLNSPDHLMFYVALFAIGIWLAAPPPFGIWRVMYWMPGLNFVRVPSRFTVVGILGLGIAAAAGFDRLMRFRGEAVRMIAGVTAIAVLIAEFWLVPMDMVRFENDAAPIDRWVGAQPQPMALLDLPMSDSQSVPLREQWTTRTMLHSMSHWKPIYVGFSGIQPPGYQENYWKLVGFPDATSLAEARRLGITHVILHSDLIAPNEREMVAAKYARFADQVQLVHAEGDGRVYVIRP